MPQFAFVAKDRMGNTVQGTLTAADLAFAANQIGQIGCSLVDLQPVTSPPLPDADGGVSPVDRTQSLNAPPAFPQTPPPQNVSAAQPTQERTAAPPPASEAPDVLADAARR